MSAQWDAESAQVDATVERAAAPMLAAADVVITHARARGAPSVPVGGVKLVP